MYILYIDRLTGQPELRARGQNRPQQLMSLSQFYIEDIAVGSDYTLALTSTGDVWGWGNNGDGQLGKLANIQYNPFQ